MIGGSTVIQKFNEGAEIIHRDLLERRVSGYLSEVYANGLNKATASKRTLQKRSFKAYVISMTVVRLLQIWLTLGKFLACATLRAIDDANKSKMNVNSDRYHNNDDTSSLKVDQRNNKSECT